MPPGAIRFPFGICRVCKDRATGVHYGVASCEGCKGFFKRTITRGDNYKCFFGGICNLEPKNRNRCKSCRFRLCLEMGMSVEAVRMGRIPKEEKEKALEIYQQNGSDYSKMEVLVQPSNTIPENKDTDEGTSPNAKAYIGKTFSKHVFKLIETSKTVTSDQENDSAASLEQNSPSTLNKETQDNIPVSNPSSISNDKGMSPSMPLDSPVKDGALSENNYGMPVYDKFPHTDTYQTEQVVDVKPSQADLLKVQQASISSSPQQKQLQQQLQKHQAQQEQLQKHQAQQHQLQKHQAQQHQLQKRQAQQNQLQKHQVQQQQLQKYQAQELFESEPQQQHLQQKHPHFQPQKLCVSQQQQQHQPYPSKYQQHHQHHPQHQHHHAYHHHQQQQFVSLQQQQQMQQLSNPVQQIYRKPAPCSTHPQTPLSLSAHLHSPPQHNASPYLHTPGGYTNMVSDFTSNVTTPLTCDRKPPISSSMHSTQLFSDHFNPNGVATFGPNHATKKAVDSFDIGSGCYKNIRTEMSHENLNQSNTMNTYDSNTPPMPQSASMQPDYKEPNKLAYLHRQISFDDDLWFDINDCDSSQPLSWSNSPPSTSSNETDSNGSQTIPDVTNQGHTGPGSMSTNGLPKKASSAGRSMDSHPFLQLSKHAGLILKVFMDQALEQGIGDVMLDRLKQALLRSSKNEKSAMSIINLIQDMIPQQTKPDPDSDDKLQDTHATRESDSNDNIEMFIRDVNTFSEQFNSVDSSMDQKINTSKNNELFELIDKFNQEHDVAVKSDDMYVSKENHRDKVNDIISLNSVYGPLERSSTSSTKYMRSDTQTFEVTSSYSVANELEMNIKLSLESMELASNILHRLKPEHRQKLKLFKQGQLHIPVMTDSDEHVKLVYSKIFQSIPQLNERVLGFSENILGFSELPKADKEVLLKRAFYDIWMLISAEYFYDGESNILLSTGELYSAAAMRRILNDKMVDTFISFSEAFNKLKLTDVEVTIFCAIQLTSTENVTLENLPAVQKLHSHLLDVFEYELKCNHSDHSSLLISIFKLMPSLAAINKLQQEVISNFSPNRFLKGGEKVETTTTTISENTDSSDDIQT